MDPRPDRSRRALLDAAIEVLLRNPGASLNEIAQAAGVGRATLYRHFESREQLLRELALESMRVIDEVTQPIAEENLDARTTLERGMIAIMQVADRFHFLLACGSLAENDPEVEAVYRRQIDELTELVEWGKSEGSIDPDLTTDLIVGLIDSLVNAGWWAVHTGSLDTDAAGRQAAQILFAGVGRER